MPTTRFKRSLSIEILLWLSDVGLPEMPRQPWMLRWSKGKPQMVLRDGSENSEAEERLPAQVVEEG
jgi:hypothetical protein